MPTLAMLRALPWKWIGLGLILAALAIQTVRLDGFKLGPVHIKGCVEKLADAKATLRSISTAKNEQKVRTETVIKYVEREREDANNQATRIERAPTPSNCETAPEVMGADL